MANSITLSMMRESLYCAVVADALDSIGLRNQSPRIPLRPYTTDRLLVGRSRTTLWADMYHPDPRPYELELRALDACQPDDVMVCAAGGSMHSALWGELLSTAAKNGGCVGAIVDGATRDIAQIRKLDFPVYARGTSVYDSLHRQRVIDLDVTVEIGGVKLSPGDLVFADVDGIVCVPREAEAEVVARAWDKVNTENQIRDSIRGGMKATTAFETYGVL